MAHVTINKSNLKQQRERLKLYERFLPSLELKKQQLLTEHKRAREQLAESEREAARLEQSLAGLYELLGGTRIDLRGLVRVESVELGIENVVGARLPVIREIRIVKTDYSTLAKPFWVDTLVERLEQACRQRIQQQVREERLRRLAVQARRITQRVNLFQKVLIPSAREQIKRIQIGLSEQERSAVIRSKLAKSRHR
ncbi:MAG: V-type ATP synthase subunit D [Pirellulaceae bacterium]|nr:V-type ATP synthase subunit D [Pirellulaceae bacterium]